MKDEVDLRFACALKTAAVNAGALKKLLCEDDLVSAQPPQDTEFAPDMLTGWQTARESCSKI